MAWPTYKPPSGIPAAHNGYRPPLGDDLRSAEPGNLDALKHGATSPRIYQPVAEELHAEVLEVRPDLAEPQYAASLRAWATAEAQCLILRDYADRVGLLDDDGNPRPFAALLNKLEGSAAKHRTRLGLDPLSNAALIKARAETAALEIHTSTALSALLERGRSVLDRRRVELGIVPPTPPTPPGELTAGTSGTSDTSAATEETGTAPSAEETER